MSYSIGHVEFKTKSDVAQHAKALLNRAELGRPLNDEDTEFVAGLFSNHPEYVNKCGLGVQFFYVGIIPAWGTRNFLLYRVDGSVDNFSIKNCISHLRPN